MLGDGGALRVGKAGALGRRRDPRRANSPGADRDQGAGRGQQRGGGAQSRDTAVDAGMRCGAQRRATEAGGWRVRATSSWAALRAGRGGGERVQTERGILR